MEKGDRARNRDHFEGTIGTVRGNRPLPAARPGWPPGLAEAYAALVAPETAAGPAPVQTRAEFERWRLVHKFIHKHPVHPDPALPRGDQWRAVHAFVDAVLGDRDVLAWIDEQAEINDNRARGRHDWRPRKDGPCFELLLEWVGNKKRTALAVHHFTEAERAAEDTETDTDRPQR